MTISAPAPLSDAHDCSVFACGEPTLDFWLQNRALKNQSTGASRTFVACQDGCVVAYYALAAGGMQISDASGRFRRNMPDPIPIIVLGRLAVDHTVQGAGIGRALLRDAGSRVAEAAAIVGIRGIGVHALSNEARQFYQAIGFEASPSDPMILAITLDDLVRSLRQL